MERTVTYHDDGRRTVQFGTAVYPGKGASRAHWAYTHTERKRVLAEFGIRTPNWPPIVDAVEARYVRKHADFTRLLEVTPATLFNWGNGIIPPRAHAVVLLQMLNNTSQQMHTRIRRFVVEALKKGDGERFRYFSASMPKGYNPTG